MKIAIRRKHYTPHPNHGRLPVASATVLLVFLAQMVPSIAADRGFFVGVTAPLDFLDVTFEKTVDNTDPNTLVPASRAGQIFQDQGSSKSLTYGFGFVAGYHLPFPGTGFFASVEFDVELPRGSVDGRLLGAGSSPGRNLLGESWPEEWSFEKKRSYGVSFKLGGSPGPLNFWDLRLYGLAGIRLVEAEFTTRFNGCLSPTPCAPGEFTSGTTSRDQDFKGYVVGAGVEKMLGDHIGFRAEMRRPKSGNEQWTTPFQEVGVTVPAAVTARSTNVSIGLITYF
ncbi:MAG: outer membrane beta-barrel protein [Candidatus Aminicenantes bacterium]|nr:outer membrane beta-barrel protein [Candidatus Aminicenantes bacterium]